MRQVMSRVLVVSLLGVGLVACSPRMPVAPETNDRLGAYFFGYEVGGRSATGLVHVFDDCKRTYFQFYPALPAKQVVMLSTRGRSEVLARDEGYFVRNGTVDSGVVLVGKRKTTVTRREHECLSSEERNVRKSLAP